MRNCFLGLTLILTVLDLPAAPVTPIKSDNFVERVAVVTHFGYGDTPYATHYDSVKTLLKQLGIRYVRDGAPSPANAWSRRIDLYTDAGIRYLMVTGSWDSRIYEAGYIDTVLARIKQYPVQAVAAIEGINEYDNSRRTEWVRELREYTRDLYTAVKSDAVLGNTPVVGPTLARGFYSQVGDLSAWVDYGALHWYPGGKEVTHGEFNYFDWHRTNALNSMYPQKKLWLTETGYNNAMNTTGHGPLSERTEAKYLPRAFLWFLFDRGIEKVFSYEFVDERADTGRTDAELNFGMVRNDLSPKPVYTALKNMISLFRDTDTMFVPQALDYSVHGDTASVRHLLFQKSNGNYMIALWKEVRSFNVVTRTDSIVPAAQVTLRMNATFDTVAAIYPCDPDSLSLRPRRMLTNVSEMTVPVADHVMILELRGLQLPSRTSRNEFHSFPPALSRNHSRQYDIRGRVIVSPKVVRGIAVTVGGLTVRYGLGVR